MDTDSQPLNSDAGFKFDTWPVGTKSEFSRSDEQNPFCSELDRCPAGFSTFGYHLVNNNATLLFQDFDVIQETTVSYKFVKESDKNR